MTIWNLAGTMLATCGSGGRARRPGRCLQLMFRSAITTAFTRPSNSRTRSQSRTRSTTSSSA
jgi:hypothetical protein